jgi:hypothetical protein
MNTRRWFRAVTGGMLGILLAGYAHGETGSASNNPPLAVPLETVEPDPAVRTASGIDLNSVKCAHAWALVAKVYLDICNPDGDTELKEDLDYEMAATAEYFITNSSHPDATKQELERETLRDQAEMAAFTKSTAVCSASTDDRKHGWLKAYSSTLRAIPSNERRARVTKLLTVPGPALRMCFP